MSSGKSLACDERAGNQDHAIVVSVFSGEQVSRLAAAEEAHFWFEVRRRLVLWAFDRYCAHARDFLEIGSGTGQLITALAATRPGLRAVGSEPGGAGLEFARARRSPVGFIELDAREMSVVGEFDTIGAFDVLEHIRDDADVLVRVHRALRDGGVLLLNVPQHAWLWSPVDTDAGHHRRYAARELHAKLEAAGFELLRSTSFVTWLLPLMAASRAWRKVFPGNPGSSVPELGVPGPVNAALRAVCLSELALIRRGVDLPAGGSRFVVARKKDIRA